MADKRSNSKTPSKSKLVTANISSCRVLRTPNKCDQPGISKTAYTHALTLQSNLKSWKQICEKGAQILRVIHSIKLFELPVGQYPEDQSDKLIKLIESLIEATNGLADIVEIMETLAKQFKAIAKLSPSSEAVIGTWSAPHIAEVMDEIVSDYRKEIVLKKYATENIAHCWDEGMSEVLATSWEIDLRINKMNEELLLSDLGVLWTE